MDAPRAPASLSACRTRTNCRMWGNSPSSSASFEDLQPPEVTGSQRPQVMWEPSRTSRRTHKPFWKWVRSDISLYVRESRNSCSV